MSRRTSRRKAVSFAIVVVACTAACGSSHGDEDATTVGAALSTACHPVNPPALAGTSPVKSSFVDHAGRPVDFPCYGACGPSCDLQERVESVDTVCQESSCGDVTEHRVLTYRRIAGDTHPFCTWHDGCYLACSRALEQDNPSQYSKCTRWCDFGCVSPNNWDRSRAAGKYDPDPSTSTVLGAIAFAATGSDADRQSSIAITKEAGDLPPVTWQPGSCALWSTAALGGTNTLTNLAPSTGREAFTELTSAEAWSPGSCAETEPGEARP